MTVRATQVELRTEPLQPRFFDVVFGHRVGRPWFANRRILDRHRRRLVGRRGRRVIGRFPIAWIGCRFVRCVLLCSHVARHCTIDTAVTRASLTVQRFDRFRFRRGPAAIGLKGGSFITLSTAERRTESFA